MKIIDESTRCAGLLLWFGLIALCLPLVSAEAQEADCLMCHEQLAKEKVVHAAVPMGCAGCHSGIDARDVPHKKKNQLARGLSAEQPELCYGCHEKGKFAKKNVHAAVGMGCTSCHNPHSSKNAKLLVSAMPDLCFTCHEKKSFMGKKSVHPPVAGGLCTNCHNPHASDLPKLLLAEAADLCYTCHDKKKFSGKYMHPPVGIGLCTKCHMIHQSDNEKLLVKEPPALCYDCHKKDAFTKKNVHVPVEGGLCLICHKPHAGDSLGLLKKEPVSLCSECHANVRRKPHAIVGMLESGHPLGIPKKGKKNADDPMRPGKRFYCGSCHNPHSSDYGKLFRYEARSGMELCQYCHKM